MHQHAVRITFPSWPEVAATLRPAFAGASCGRDSHLTGVLHREDVPPGHRQAGPIGPPLDQLCRCHLRAGEEPTRPQLAAAIAAQPAQANRLARNHPFEDRTPLL